MIFKYKDLPTWQKVLFFPFWVISWVVRLAWVVVAGIAALLGTALGQGARLLAILLYFVWMWAFIGWLEAQGMAARGEADRRKAADAGLDNASAKKEG